MLITAARAAVGRAARSRLPSRDWARFRAGAHATRRLVVVGLGTMAFGMADVLLEPYGGQVLDWSVSQTTTLTALLAAGGLVGFAVASRALAAGGEPYRLALQAALIGVPAFGLVIVAAPLGLSSSFLAGNVLIGFGAALFGHATLTATMKLAPPGQAGLALGAWGAVQATAAGVALALGGVIRDSVVLAADLLGATGALAGPAAGYLTVYALEIALLLVTVVAVLPLARHAAGRTREAPVDAPAPVAAPPR